MLGSVHVQKTFRRKTGSDTLSPLGEGGWRGVTAPHPASRTKRALKTDGGMAGSLSERDVR